MAARFPGACAMRDGSGSGDGDLGPLALRLWCLHVVNLGGLFRCRSRAFRAALGLGRLQRLTIELTTHGQYAPAPPPATTTRACGSVVFLIASRQDFRARVYAVRRSRRCPLLELGFVRFHPLLARCRFGSAHAHH